MGSHCGKPMWKASVESVGADSLSILLLLLGSLFFLFIFQGEIERHRVLYHRERQARLKIQHRLTFYKQLELRLKQVAPGSMKERLSWLFEGKQQEQQEQQERGSEDGTPTANTASNGSLRYSHRSSRAGRSGRTASASNLYPSAAPTSLYSSASSSTYTSTYTPTKTSTTSSSSSTKTPTNGSIAMATLQSLRTMSVSELRYFLNERYISQIVVASYTNCSNLFSFLFFKKKLQGIYHTMIALKRLNCYCVLKKHWKGKKRNTKNNKTPKWKRRRPPLM